MQRLRVATVVALPALLLAGCGDPSSPPAAGGWRTEQLDGRTAVDFPSLLATDGDEALVLMVSDDGVLQSHLSVDGGRFEAGEPLETGERYVDLGGAVRLADGSWYALGSGGVEPVDGDEESLFAPVAFRSPDGLVWERVDVTGFADAVDVGDVLVTSDGTLVAAGSYRTEDNPGMGGFEAHVWVSADGRSFDQVVVPGVPEYRSYDDESSVGDLVVSGGALLAGGRVGDKAVLWRSTDGGATWELDEDPLLDSSYTISGLGAVGDTVVASVVGQSTQAIRSTDGGRTWERADLPVDEEAEAWAPLWSGAGRFFTLTGVDDRSWSQPEVCYADLDQCGRNPEPALVSSTDGVSWTAVDTRGLGELDQVAGAADGRILVMAGGEGSSPVDLHTWPSSADLPVADEPATPRTVELVELPEGEEPQTGVTYHAPMWLHCGMDWFWFGDTTWRRTDDGPGVETGAGEAVPEEWPVSGQTLYGYATVRDNGVLEYSLEDGTVIATYEQRAGAPGCD
jgi:hypothetical protein